jgi:hypothetical protein
VPGSSKSPARCGAADIISGVIDDNNLKLSAFMAFKGGVARERRFRDYGRRGDNNRVIATTRIVSFVHYKYGGELLSKIA